MTKKEDMGMKDKDKDKKLTHLGEINLMDFQAVILRYTADLIENQNLFLQNPDIFCATRADAARLIHIYLKSIYLEASLASGFIPCDLTALEGDSEFQTPEENTARNSYDLEWRKRLEKDPQSDSDETLQDLQRLRTIGIDMDQYLRNVLDPEYPESQLTSGFIPFDLAEYAQKTAQATEEDPHKSSCFHWGEGYKKDTIIHSRDIRGEDPGKRQRSSASSDFNRSILSDFHEKSTGHIMGQPDNLEITPEDLQGFRKEGVDIEQCIRDSLVPLDYLQHFNRGFIPTHLVKQEDDEDDRTTDICDNVQPSRNRQPCNGLKGLKDFAQLLESNERSTDTSKSYPCKGIDSETNMREGPFSSILPLEEKMNKGFKRLIRKIPPHQKQEDGIGFINNKSDTNEKAESYLFRNEKERRSPPGPSNTDLDVIMETLAREINREYKRFYGSY